MEFICKYCGKYHKNKNSLAQHECRCPNNPNKIKSGGWNKGLTKETDSRLAKAANTLAKSWAAGVYQGVKWLNNSHPHSKETKKRLREAAIERGLGGYTYNKSYEYNGFYFDSTWEVVLAKSLDENKINWVRPERLFYTDNECNLRYYYPDFYLEDYNVYLDPKNDYLLNNPHSGHNYSDKDKIKWVEEQNNVKIIVLNEEQLNWDQVKKLLS